jgi:hypothetical protein
MKHPKDLTGMKFGHLTVVGKGQRREINGRRRTFIPCICSCGDPFEAERPNLLRGSIVSCPKRHTIVKHGHTVGRTASLTYSSYCAMKDRCLNPNAPHYHRYGGRGIRICDRWLGDDGFDAFVDDMGERPSRKHTLERIWNDGPYNATNCKWATRKEQAQNRSTARTHSWNGQEYTLAELSKATGISKDRLRHRICRAGWSVERAVSIKQSVQGQTLW